MDKTLIVIIFGGTYVGYLLFGAIIALIAWKILYDVSVMVFGIIAGLIVVFCGYCIKEESEFGGIIVMLLGIVVIALGIIFRDVSIGVFVDSIPKYLMFWK